MAPILYCQPIFCPDGARLDRNIASLESLRRYMDHHGIDLSMLRYSFGGWCKTEESWKIITAKLKALFNVEATRFDKNYGKATVVNRLIESATGIYTHILTADSDIIFCIEEPCMFDRLLDAVRCSENIRGIPCGLVALQQKGSNCHIPVIFENQLEYSSGESLVWPTGCGGIAGGCLFISWEAWHQVGGYRVMGVYAGDDAFLMIDMMAHGFSIQVIDTLAIIHPPDNDGTYSAWKRDMCHREQRVVGSDELAPMIEEAVRLWS